jgi:hypothetical protein
MVSELITAPELAPRSPGTHTDERLGDVHGLRCIRGVGNMPDQQDRVAGRLDLDLGARKGRAQGLAQDVEVAPNRDFQRRDLLAVAIHGKDRSGTVGHADDEELAGRTHHGIGDAGVGHEHFLGVAGQIDDQRLADRQIKLLGAGTGAARGDPMAGRAALGLRFGNGQLQWQEHGRRYSGPMQGAAWQRTSPDGIGKAGTGHQADGPVHDALTALLTGL